MDIATIEYRRQTAPKQSFTEAIKAKRNMGDFILSHVPPKHYFLNRFTTYYFIYVSTFLSVFPLILYI